MKSGIYQIRNIINGKVYIGSACDVMNRWYNHKYQLRHNKHHTIHLQRAWNKYGEENFVFEILEEVEDEGQLLIIEQKYLDKALAYDYKTGYNSAKYADASGKGIYPSEETRKKMSEAQKGKVKLTKGKTYEEIYGKEKADIIKRKQSEATGGIRNPMHGIQSPNKGKTYEEIFGKELAKEIRQKHKDNWKN